MKAKTLLFMCFLILFCGVKASAGSREIRMTISELNLSWADYENKIIRIEFNYATGISQVNKGIYCANLWDEHGNNVYAEFKTTGFNYMQRTTRKRRWYISAIVVRTTLQNKYGATSVGPMLKLIGRRHQSMGFKPTYRW